MDRRAERFWEAQNVFFFLLISFLTGLLPLISVILAAPPILELIPIATPASGEKARMEMGVRYNHKKLGRWCVCVCDGQEV